MLMGDNATPALVGSGSVMIADNILWYGKVAQADARDLHTTRIREFNRMVAADPRVEQAVIPIRDGMSIVRVR
jgi:caffeoyl-CoA O-methyltransferase